MTTDHDTGRPASLWVVQRMMKSIGIAVKGYVNIEQQVSLSDKDGMVGALPVFATREQAEAYGDGAPLMEITYAQ